jgi:hypothetical protein
MRDFTYKSYKKLLARLKSKGYQFFRFMDYQKAMTSFPMAIMRHDVDRFPRKALLLAKLERSFGITSSYFFRVKRGSFQLKTMKAIQNMGHEIGYHYEELGDCRGDFHKAWKKFEENLCKFAPIGGVSSIAMHGRPFSRWNNADLWKHFDYRKMGISVEAYTDIDWSRFLYLTDTGRKWNGMDNRRDRVTWENQIHVSDVKTTSELLRFLDDNTYNLIISVHPERWSEGWVDWLFCWILDVGVNCCKRALHVSNRTRV